MTGHFGHQRGWSHSRLSIDLEPDDFAIFGEAIVVAKVGSANATATNCLMRP